MTVFAQGGDLVVGVRFGDPLVEVAGGDVGQLGPDADTGASARPTENQVGPGHHGQQQRDPDDQHPGQRLERHLGRPQRGPDRERGARVERAGGGDVTVAGADHAGGQRGVGLGHHHVGIGDGERAARLGLQRRSGGGDQGRDLVGPPPHLVEAGPSHQAGAQHSDQHGRRDAQRHRDDEGDGHGGAQAHRPAAHDSSR